MFVGHYAVSLALKRTEPKIPLWQLFLAVQAVDVAFFSLSFVGIESFNIVPNYTASTHFELVHMPYTHGLAATFVWGLATLLLFGAPRFGGSVRIGLVVAAAVVSHWFLDFVVHTPDLPLLGADSMKVGLGLWNSSVGTFTLEALLLGLATWWLLRSDSSKRVRNRTIGFVAALIVINVGNIFGPAGNASTTTLAVVALAAYFGFAAIAYWAVDRPAAAV